MFCNEFEKNRPIMPGFLFIVDACIVGASSSADKCTKINHVGFDGLVGSRNK